MSVHYQSFPLNIARQLVDVFGSGALFACWLSSDATVTPQLVVTDPGGGIQTIDVTAPINQSANFSKLQLVNAPGLGTLYLATGDDPREAIGVAGSAQRSGGDRFLTAFWDPLAAATVAGALDTSWRTASGIFTTPPFWVVDAAAGGAAVMTVHGSRCAILTPNGGRINLRLGLLDVPWIPQRALALPADGPFLSSPDIVAQSWWLELLVRRDAPTAKADFTQAFGFYQAAAPFPGGFAGGNAAMVIGNTATDGWVFGARAVGGGPVTINQGIAPPASSDFWMRWGFHLVNADAKLGRDGIFRVYLDGVKVVEVTNMALLPPPFAAGPASTGYAFVIGDSGANNGNQCVQQVKLWSTKGEGVAQV